MGGSKGGREESKEGGREIRRKEGREGKRERERRKDSLNVHSSHLVVQVKVMAGECQVSLVVVVVVVVVMVVVVVVVCGKWSGHRSHSLHY